MTNTANDRTHINIGLGVELVSDRYIVQHLGSAMTLLGFRLLCRNLGLPLLYIGKTGYVNQGELSLCMQAISRLGEPDFYTPGSKPHNGATVRRKLSVPYFRENWRRFVLELSVVRRLRFRKERSNAERKALQEALRQAGARLAQSQIALMPTTQRERAVGRSLAAARRNNYAEARS